MSLIRGQGQRPLLAQRSGGQGTGARRHGGVSFRSTRGLIWPELEGQGPAVCRAFVFLVFSSRSFGGARRGEETHDCRCVEQERPRGDLQGHVLDVALMRRVGHAIATPRVPLGLGGKCLATEKA